MDLELHKQALDLLEANFDIKLAMDCRTFDLNPNLLIEKLIGFQGHHFKPRDKILLVHMDVDYYDPVIANGLIPINVIRIFKNLDIPMHALLFVTNHFGISKEFDSLLQDQSDNDRPMIIETFLSSLLLSDSYCSQLPISFDDIKKAGLCLMRKSRSHRVAFYNFLLDNNLVEKVAVNQNFNAH